MTFDVDFEEFLQWVKGGRQSGGIVWKVFQADEGIRGEVHRDTGARWGLGTNVSNTQLECRLCGFVGTGGRKGG